MNQVDYQAILASLTLEEKASLCSGLTFWKTAPVDRVGIPSVLMTDGPHGVRHEQESVGTNIMSPAHPATCFPPAVTTASSWDPSLAEAEGRAIAEEARAQKITTVLGPGVNIKRSPLCGRNFEYFSEDPLVAGTMGSAWVRGAKSLGVGASLKHFCANNQEHLRMCIDTIVDERALREIYLPAFEQVVKETQPAQVMCSYNRLNGTYLSDNKRMLTDILRDEWGFEGIVVSDWGAVNDRLEGIRAGMDLEMPGNRGANDKVIVKAVKDGVISEEELDRVVLRLIKFAFECKANEVEGADPKFEEHHALAAKIASESAVLLKNENGTLPVAKDAKIAVIGALAEKPRYQGSGSSNINPTRVTSFLNALDEENIPYVYAPGYKFRGDGYSAHLVKKAAEAAKDADVVLLFIGLTPKYESEGFDRRHIDMPDGHVILAEEIAKVNPNIVTVLSCGSPVQLDRVEPVSRAILNMYLGGQAVGLATRDIIFGKVNPSGKLAETFPLRESDNISSHYFPQGPRNVQYRESVFVGYRYFDTADKPVRYPFGYGLSYTSFEYSDLKLSATDIDEDDALEVCFKVKNTGSRDGAEVAELYVSDRVSSVFRPKKELRAFKKVFLKAGEETTVTLTLGKRAFAYYNVLISDWHVESGEFDILVGASSADIRLSATVTVRSSAPDAPIPDYRECAPAYYEIAAGGENKQHSVPVEQFAALIGTSIVENTPYAKGEFDRNSCLSSLVASPVGKFMNSLIVGGAKMVAGFSENGDMIVRSAQDMPLRAFMGFTGGMISSASVEALAEMCNGVKGSFRRFIKGFKRDKSMDAYSPKPAMLSKKARKAAAKAEKNK